MGEYSLRSHPIPTLDGWRAVAILSVMAYHQIPPGARGYAVATHGHHGVPLFFGISGFLITSLLLNEQEITGGIDLAGFYLRRVFRILPPVVAFLGVASLLGVLGLGPLPTLLEVLSGLFFFRNYVPTTFIAAPVAGHFWSLSVEEHFYLFWPGLLVLIGSRRRALGVALGLTALVVVWRFLDSRYQLLSGLLPNVDPTQRTDTSIDGLMCGAALALASRVSRWKQLFHDPRWRFSQVPLLLAYALVVWRQPPLSRFMESALVPLLLWSTVSQPRTSFSRVLQWPVLRAIGVLSYSLYVWHLLFMTARYEVPPAWKAGVLGLMWTGCAAVVSYFLLEEPLRNLGRRLAAAHKPVRLSDVSVSPS